MSQTRPNRRILIVGEGQETEYNYFVGFRNRFADELAANAITVKVARGKGGNARNIVENAIKESKKFEPDRNRGDRVFLLLDTEGVERAPELTDAENVARRHRIEIVYSCPSFEYWLLCHLPRVPRGYFADCASVIVALNKKWADVSKASYEKSDEDLFDRVAPRLNFARSQALAIDLHHMQTGQDARRANPSSQVYELVAMLVGVASGEKCPIEGEWKRAEDPTSPRTFSKGETMPTLNGKPTVWYR